MKYKAAGHSSSALLRLGPALTFSGSPKKKKPRISKIRKAIKQQLGHLKRNLGSIDALIACGGRLLAAGRHIYQKLLVVSELVRQ